MSDSRNDPQYKEWVLPSWASFLPVLAIWPSVWLVFLPINQSLGLGLATALTVLVIALMFAKSARIYVDNETLTVANARLERKYIQNVEVVGEDKAFEARGSSLHPLAWIHFQGSVKTLIRVNLQDENDPTPYWLFSTRRPAELAKALEG